MADSFHISEDGVARPCGAQPGNCPLGGEHFGSIEEARAHAEVQLAETHGIFAKVKSDSPFGPGAVKADDGSYVLPTNDEELELMNANFGWNIVESDTLVSGHVWGRSDVDRVAFVARDYDEYSGDDPDTEREQVAEYIVSSAQAAKYQLGSEGRSAFVEWASTDPDAVEKLKEHMVIENSYYGRAYVIPFLSKSF